MFDKSLSTRVTAKNVCRLALIAVDLNAAVLRQKCVGFIADQLFQQSPPPGLESLPAEIDKEIVLYVASKYKK